MKLLPMAMDQDTLNLVIEAAVRGAICALDVVHENDVEDEADDGGGTGKAFEPRQARPDPIDAPHVKALMAEVGELRALMSPPRARKSIPKAEE